MASAQSFIRALKASSDPPHPDGPLKIELAKQAWEETSLYIPNKAEVIVDWILSRLLKHKSRNSDPLLDDRYWQLLAEVLWSDGLRAGGFTRAAKAWLIPLLNRVPMAPIVRDFFAASLSAGPEAKTRLNALVSRCLVVIWPLAVPKFTAEALLECYGAVLSWSIATSTGEVARDGVNATQAQLLVVQSYRAALANAANKKKIYTTFVHNHLATWLSYIHLQKDEITQPQSLTYEIFSAGIDTLFSLEVLRQAGDHKFDVSLKAELSNFTSASSEASLASLPRLFAAFMQSIKRYKSALFGQGSNQAPGDITQQVQATGMAFFASCDDLLSQVTQTEQLWQTRIALLSIVDSEKLYDIRDDHAAELLRHRGQLSINALGSLSESSEMQRAECAVELLSALTRIDYDLMSSALSTILPKFIAMSDRSSSVLTYLSLILDYHGKTRRMPSLIACWLEAFSVRHLQAAGQQPRETYHSASSGPLLNRSFLSRLSRSIYSFLTPGQVSELVRCALQTLKDAFVQFSESDAANAANNGGGARKKRKKTSDVFSTSVDPEWAAVSFALSARAIVEILKSLPMHPLLAKGRHEIQQSMRVAYSATVPVALQGALDKFGNERRDTWGWQIVASAALRVHYSLTMSPRLQLNIHCDEKVASEMLSSVLLEETLPEFSLEMFRSLLSETAQDWTHSEIVFDRILLYLERHLSHRDVFWSGRSHDLASNTAYDQGAIALTHHLFDRWLPHFHAHASDEQLARLASLTVSMSHDDDCPTGQRGTQKGLNVSLILTRALRNAEFWELHRLRDVLLVEVQRETAALESTDVYRALSQLTDGTEQSPIKDLRKISTAYEILLHAPAEYLPRAFRQEFLRRALAADVTTASMLRTERAGSGYVHSTLVVREFIRRTLAYLGTVDHAATTNYATYLMRWQPPSPKGGQLEDELISITLDIIGMHSASFLKAARKGEDDSALVLTRTFNESLAFGFSSKRNSQYSLCQQSLLKFIDTLTAYHESSYFSEALRGQLEQLQTHMTSIYLPLMVEMLAKDTEAGIILQKGDLLQAWSCTLKLRRWLSMDEGTGMTFGHLLVGKLLSLKHGASSSSNICIYLSDILFAGALTCVDDNRPVLLQCLIAAYLAFSRLWASSDLSELDARLSTAFRELALSDFEYILELVSEALSNAGKLSSGDIASLVRLSSIMVHDAPQGSSRSSQTHVTRCLNLFADRSIFLTSSLPRHAVLSFMSCHFNDHPVSIRSMDLSSIWSILGTLLAGSAEHDSTTDANVFHEVVTILNALVRLRRDLVLRALPHLGMLLRQLTMAFRSLRPHLGRKQSRLVMNTLPRWISVGTPLSAEESKALARLMTTLTVKTIVRTHGSSSDSQKPESLARPFSKHAAYVLTAYIDAVNDPLCIIPTQVRRELQPGLFALCDMLAEHNRDAMMVSALSAGGKATMKALWKEYEKQRYTGKG